MVAEPLELTLGPLVFDAVAEGPADGAPVLLLHGFPETSWSWRYVQPRLAEAGLRSVAPDLRGYSPRARPTEPADYAIEVLVADVLGLLDALGWERAHLVGHDWGGALAWQVAGRHPERLHTLTVVSTPHPAALLRAKQAGPGADDDQAARSSYMDLFRQPGSEHLLLADGPGTLVTALEAAGLDRASATHHVDLLGTPEALVGPLNWYRGADPGDAEGLGPITVPTLYVWSDGDVALGPTAAHLTAEHVEGPYRFEVLEGVSHWIPEEAPDRLVAAVLAHLASFTPA